MAEIDKIRNIAVIGHSNSGKTTLVEAMLFGAGAIDRLGTVLDGNTVTDFEPEEIHRKITISSAPSHCTWKGHNITIIDTPGFINFLEDARGALRVADGAVVLASAESGIKGETERLMKYAEDFGVPTLVFVNKVDREGADFDAALANIEKTYGKPAIALNFPMGSAENFTGVVDLMSMRSFLCPGTGKAAEEGAIPPELMARADELKTKLIEKAAEGDDALIEKYLETGELTEDEILHGMREGSRKRIFVPVVVGSAIKNMGIHRLLEAIVMCLPSPVEFALKSQITGKNPKDGSEITRTPEPNAPLSAFVFKTIADPYAGKLSLFRVYSGTIHADSTVYNSSTEASERIGQIFVMQGKKNTPVKSLGPGEIGAVAKLKDTHTGNTLSDEAQKIVFEEVAFAEPMISYAIEAKNKGDEDKISTGLHKVLEEDPTLRFSRDEEAKEMHIAGMGQVHLEVTLEKLKRKFGVEVVMKAPKIPYRETIRAKAEAQGRYKKQSGGKGQFGDCWIKVEPLPRGSGYEFVDDIVGGSIPRNYIPAVDKGIQEAMHHGLYAGFPVVDLRVSVFDGSYHAVDSSEMAFKIAGSFAIKKAFMDARPVILEPMMEVAITVPEEALGTIIGDLNSRRGKVHGMDAQGNKQVISAAVPMAEMLTYANQLQSMTAGRGTYHMEFSHYDELPAHMAQKLVDERKKDEEEK